MTSILTSLARLKASIGWPNENAPILFLGPYEREFYKHQGWLIRGTDGNTYTTKECPTAPAHTQVLPVNQIPTE